MEKTRLVRMEIEDFMRCRLVRLDFDPKDPVTRIRGKNANGKSSVLRAFWALVGGKDACPEEPIREGAESAQVLGELANGLIIKRRFTAGGTRLEVSSRDGAVYKRPQEILDALVGRISFDPLAFLNLDAKKQREALQRIAGVDTDPIEAARRVAYDQRTVVNRTVATLRARLEATPEVDAPEEIQSAADLIAEQTEALKVKAANDRRRNELRTFRDVDYARAAAKVTEAAQRVTSLEAQLAAARGALTEAEAEKAAVIERGNALKAEVLALVDPDTSITQEKIAQLEQRNDAVRAKRARLALREELGKAVAESARLGAEVDECAQKKKAALAQAKFPVPGLGFSDGGITYNGITFEQASQAERIKVAMAMGLAMNPNLPVVCIRDGSLLDEDSLALVRQMATEAGAQILLEMVGTGGGGVVIEDGEVVEVDGVAAAAGGAR